MDKNTEYTMLKQEIINTSDIIINITIAMYTISISIFVFAFEFGNYFIFLLTYMILFSFQNMINRKKDGINRLAAYIAVYLEEGNGWESMLSDNMLVFRAYDKKLMTNSRLWNFLIGRTNATQLGLFSTVFFFSSYIPKVNWQAVTIADYSLMCVSVILLFLLFMSNKREFSNVSMRELYIQRLKQNKECKECNDASKCNCVQTKNHSIG